MAGSSDTIRNLLACGMWGRGLGGPATGTLSSDSDQNCLHPIRALRSLAGKPEVLGAVGGDPRRRHEERLAPAAHAPCVAGRQVDGRKKYDAGSAVKSRDVV